MSRRDLIFEIGVEEIPSAPLYDAIAQFGTLAEKRLQELRLPYEAVRTYGAPRRLVLYIVGLAEQQEAQDLRVKGPSVKVAFDAEGLPTKAVEGFARGQGVAVEDLVRETESSGEYVFALKHIAAAPALEVLPDMLAQLAADLTWPKSQRWGSGEARFIRPVRWLLALFGSDVVPVPFAGLIAGRTTYGHRFLSAGAIEVSGAMDYYRAAQDGRFVFDHEERARLVDEGVARAAAAAGGSAVMPDKTRAEVINLVEWPTVAVGAFDPDFLSVPREILETAMESHQRYFPLEGPDGGLLPAFVVTHNGDPARTDAIVAGHERVIRARLSDAAFFYREDLKVPMEDWVERLETIVFQKELGTLSSKVERIEALVTALAGIAGADAGETAQALRAAHLCKTDLVSHAVVEFPSLQGVMGRYYALAAGEDASVADAIVEHYRPRFAGDAVPGSVPGMLVSAADKLDTMCGIFGIGQAPTGSGDPYALRRGAIGILSMVLDGGLRLQLTESIAAALAGYETILPNLSKDEVGEAVASFLKGRLENMLRDRGHAYDIVAAVLDLASDDPGDTLARCEALTAFRTTQAGADLLVAFKRASNLADASRGAAPDPAIMGDEERALYEALLVIEAEFAELVRVGLYGQALGALAGLRAPVDTFFERVLVMDPDEAVRDNRLRLLNRVVALFDTFAALSQLAG
ncbi:MAG: glycine--tRNA ligase subunit beta [Coriobacteriia bacterium]|nr:glycine--tRNA ligase subunit beta [Coriobacteriia bacterium]